VSTALTLPAAAEAFAKHAAPLHVVPAATSLSEGAQEANRWLLGMGLPFLAASLFVAAAIGSGIGWLLAPALASLGVAILSLTWLAISSDTNA
jgi:hypothetical protein